MPDGRMIVHLYGSHYAVLDVGLAWHRAGRPTINSAGRLKREQQKARDDFLAGRGSPADDPNRPDLYELGHVRFCALDISYTWEREQALFREGLMRPFDYENWHYRPWDLYYYPLVEFIPANTPSINAFTTIVEAPPAPPAPTVGPTKEKDMIAVQIKDGAGLLGPKNANRFYLVGGGVFIETTDFPSANELSVLANGYTPAGNVVPSPNLTYRELNAFAQAATNLSAEEKARYAKAAEPTAVTPPKA